MRAEKFTRKHLGGAILAAMACAGVCAGGTAALAKSRHAARHAGSSSSPALAATSASGGMSSAEKLRRLDIMLLVTGLRCRSTPDDFQPDFQLFETRHRSDLNAADRQLRVQFGGRHGNVSAKAMDHINVEMANVYGNGHPWMGCHDLKGVVQDLASMKGTAPLLTVADQLLASNSLTPPKMVSQL